MKMGSTLIWLQLLDHHFSVIYSVDDEDVGTKAYIPVSSVLNSLTSKVGAPSLNTSSKLFWFEIFFK